MVSAFWNVERYRRGGKIRERSDDDDDDEGEEEGDDGVIESVVEDGDE